MTTSSPIKSLVIENNYIKVIHFNFSGCPLKVYYCNIPGNLFYSNNQHIVKNYLRAKHQVYCCYNPSCIGVYTSKDRYEDRKCRIMDVTTEKFIDCSKQIAAYNTPFATYKPRNEKPDETSCKKSEKRKLPPREYRDRDAKKICKIAISNIYYYENNKF